MAVSAFDIFKIGIGPSSSHTVGPMRAAARFAERWLEEKGVLDRVVRVRAELYGSLALTGRGHGTDRAVLLGLEGEAPDQVDPASIDQRIAYIRQHRTIALGGKNRIFFHEGEHLVFYPDAVLPGHPNGLRFTAFQAKKAL